MENKQYHNALPVNYKLHWYVIKEVLGRGGFGITYLAIDTNLNKKVAIKEFLPSELCYRDNTDSVNPLQTDSKFQYDWGLERFISEAQTLAQFEHPNIVRVIAVFEENNTGYMVMNYEEGDELQTLLTREKTLDEDFLLLILFPLLDGLEKIHSAGFIHRDIKPQNIMLRPNGTPILIDFGSARQALGGKTSTMTSLVSPGYAPFEQYYTKGDKQGPWTDIYALAATMYRCVSGKLPLSAVDRSEGIVHGTGDYFVSAVEIGEGRYSEQFLKAIDRGLCFKPEDRPQSIAEWRKDFAGLEDHDSDNFIDDDYDDETPTVQAIENLKSAGKKPVADVQPGKKRNIPAYITGFLLFVAIIFLLISNWQKIPDYFGSIQDQIIISEENKNKDKINTLLEKAERSLASNQLIDPQDQSAYYYYNEILKIDPDNATAINGLDKVFIGLFEKTKTAISSGNYEQAGKYLAIADQLKPDSEIIRLSQKVLDEKLTEQNKLEAERKEREKILDEITRNKERIASLLDMATSSLDKNQLISPQGNNARYHYKQVLQLEPENDQALAGLQNISQTYITKAEQAVNLKDYVLAKEYLAIADETSPGDDAISKSTKELKDKINQKLENKEQENKQNNQVQNLLAAAEQDMKALRLASPTGNNALEKYNTVLDLDPANKTALAGKMKISEKYLSLARGEMEKGNLNKAHDQLTTARKISPELSSVNNALNELEIMMASEEKQQQQLEMEQQRIEEEKRRLAEEERIRNEEQQRLLAEEQQKKQQALETEIEKLKAEKEKEQKLQEQNEIFSITVSQVANKFQAMGFNSTTLANEIAALLRNYGFKVIQQQNAGINNGSVMEVIFQPKEDSTGKLVQWDATVSANYLGSTVWSENEQKKGNARELYGVKVHTESIDDLRPAQESIKKMIGNFITRYRGNWPPKY